MGIFDKITGRSSRKRRERELENRIREFQESTGRSSKTLRDLMSRLLEESGTKTQALERERISRQSGLTDLINRLRGEAEIARESQLGQLRGGIESAFGLFGTGAEGLEERLRQNILSSLTESRTGLEQLLGQKEAGIQSELNRYLQGEFTRELPEIEAQLASRGLSLQGGTAGESLARELSRLGGVRFQTLSDLARERAGTLEDQLMRELGVRQALEERTFGTGREDLLNRLQQALTTGQQEFGVTREDFLRGQQQQLEDYLRGLGFARENELAERQFGYGLRGQQLPLEQNLQQLYLQSLQPGVSLAEQRLAGAQAREGSFLGGLANLAGNILTNFALPRIFPSAQDQYLKSLMGQGVTQLSGGIFPQQTGVFSNFRRPVQFSQLP